MTIKQINQLTRIAELLGEDLLPVWDTSAGATRKSSIQSLLDLLAPIETDRVYAAVESGDDVTLAQTTNNIWLLLENLSGGASAITVIPPGSPPDGQEILISKKHDAAAGNITFTLSAYNETNETISTLTNARLSTRIKYDETTGKWWAAGY